MTRKHFIEIARTINEQRQEIEDFIPSDEFKENDAAYQTLRSAAIRLAATFGGFNDNFDYQRFLTACGF